MKPLKVVIDNKIPFIAGTLEPFAEIRYLDPAEITAETVYDADALIIRTRTCCNRNLLEGSRVRFIGTATIGFDHIDATYCREQGIFWTNAPGCNAASVTQYIAASLSLLARRYEIPLAGQTIGIVGVGHVGSRVKQVSRSLGLKVLLNDPPRSRQEKGFVSLEQICEESDFITFHTPLTRGGDFNTYHLADRDFFDKLKRNPVIINSSRGEVVDNRLLLQALCNGSVKDAVMDCWENEPEVSTDLLHRSYIATPHIAGYSADGKSNGTKMIVDAFARYFNLNIPTTGIQPPEPENNRIVLHTDGWNAIHQAILSTYNPDEDSRQLKKNPDRFEWQRGHYPLRREFQAYRVSGATEEQRHLLEKLGFNISPR